MIVEEGQDKCCKDAEFGGLAGVSMISTGRLPTAVRTDRAKAFYKRRWLEVFNG